MELIKLTVKEFIDICASDAPAPGGGSVSALVASLGSSLTLMVGALTIGKKKYAQHEAENIEISSEMKKINDELLLLIDKDTEAFELVSAVFSLPRETEEEKVAWRAAMQEGLKAATIVPFRIMEVTLAGIKQTAKAVGKSNTNAASDLGVAALNLNSGLHGAWLNVLINIAGIKDEAFANDYRKRGEALLSEGKAIAENIYSEVLKSL